MNDEQILKLARLVEPQLCGILIENNICSYRRTPKDKSIKSIINKFDNLTVLEPYNEDLDFRDVSDEQVTALRNLYPSQSTRKGTSGIIKNKLVKYLNNNPHVSYSDISNCIKEYVQESVYSGKVDMLFDLDNIFYKQEAGGVKSPIEGLLGKYSKTNTASSTSNMVID